MIRRLLLLGAFLVVVTPQGSAGAVELANDSFSAGATVFYQDGFAIGEIGAARLLPPSAGTWQLRVVRFLFGGATTTETVTLHVWDDSAGNLDPGTELYTADYDLAGQDDARQEIDLTGESIFVTGAFRIGLEFNHAGVPSIAADGDDSTTPERNFIKVAAGWRRATDLQMTRDWIVRAEVTSAGGPDAGVADAGSRDASRDSGAIDAGPNDSDDGGCGCRTGTSAGPPPALGWALIALVALLGRRRSARR